MSSKSSIMLTTDNEHWYDDCSEPLTQIDELRKNAITLEFDKKNIRVDCNDKNNLIITITNPNCDIYKLLEKIQLLRIADDFGV